MIQLLWVCCGSAIGGGLRYLVTLGALRWLGPAFPFGTLFVNVVGSFLIGAIMHLGLTSNLVSPDTRLFLTTGVLGGLTTYSAFNYDTLELARGGAALTGVLNVAVTLFTCLLAGTLGLAVGRWVLRSLTTGS